MARVVEHGVTQQRRLAIVDVVSGQRSREIGETVLHRGIGQRARIRCGQRRRVVGAGDVDRQRRGRGRAERIVHRVGEDVGNVLPLRQRLGSRAVVIERVDPGAVGIDRHATIGAGNRGRHVIRSRDRPPVPLATPCTVLVSPVSTSRSLERTLPDAVSTPANGVLPGLTPCSTTGAPGFTSVAATGEALATGASLVPVMSIVSVVVEMPP